MALISRFAGLWFLITVFILYPARVLSNTTTPSSLIFHVPTYSDNSHHYYHELLQASLHAIGYQSKLVTFGTHLPQKRAVKMVEEDKLSLCWLLHTLERDNRFTPVRVGITNNLIGTRVLLIPKGEQHVYDGVRNLVDFQALNLSGAFGANWYDIRVWETNGLGCVAVDGEWRKIYRLLSFKPDHFHYFSRGINEIVPEHKQHPYLDIEKKLVFIYENDFYFYLSTSSSKHKDLLEYALRMSKTSGLMDRLINKYWSDIFERLGFDKRVQIHLRAPE